MTKFIWTVLITVHIFCACDGGFAHTVGTGLSLSARYKERSGRAKKKILLQTVCPKVKFRPPFQRRWFPKVKPLVALRTGRNLFLCKSAGGEAKQSGGLFWRGEPSPGVPRHAPAVRAAARRIAAFTFCEKQPCPPDISCDKTLRAGMNPAPTQPGISP